MSFFFKLLNKIHDTTDHSVRNIIIYNIVFYKFISFVFKISLFFVRIYEYISNLEPVHINFN